MYGYIIINGKQVQVQVVEAFSNQLFVESVNDFTKHYTVTNTSFHPQIPATA